MHLLYSLTFQIKHFQYDAYTNFLLILTSTPLTHCIWQTAHALLKIHPFFPAPYFNYQTCQKWKEISVPAKKANEVIIFVSCRRKQQWIIFLSCYLLKTHYNSKKINPDLTRSWNESRSWNLRGIIFASISVHRV